MTLNRFLSVLICLIFLATNKMYAHKEWVHQYILKESYKLLYNEFGNIPELAKVCGFDNFGNETWYYEQNISEKNVEPTVPLFRGIWIEDTDDILFEKNNPPPNQILNPGIASAMHFWNADAGYDSKCMLESVYYPDEFNALHKSLTYYECLSEDLRIEDYYIPATANLGFIKIGIETDRIFIKYDNIFDLYKIGNVDMVDYNWNKSSFLGIPLSIDNILSIFKNKKPHVNNIDEQAQFISPYIPNRQVHSLSNIGRILHLLTDMSVPAHVHVDIHPCTSFGAILQGGDTHEQSMGHCIDGNGLEYSWDSNDWCNYGPLVNGFLGNTGPDTFIAKEYYDVLTSRNTGSLVWEAFEDYSDKDFLKFLFYNLNQLADIYPSNNIEVWEVSDGDKNFYNSSDYKNVSPFLIDKFATITPSNYYRDQADEVFNYAIRISATYLYWVAKNLNWLSDEQNLFCQNRPKDMSTYTNIKNHNFLGRYDKIVVKPLGVNNNTAFHTSNIMRVGKLESITDIPDGDVIIDPSARIDLSSKAEIHFKPGFHAKRGSDLVASINNNTCLSNTEIQVGVQSSKSSNDLSSNFSKFEQSIFTVFPNPTSNKINCSYNNLGEENKVKITIFDQYSNLITEIQENAKKGNNIYTIDLSNYPSGTYYVVLNNNINTYSNKISVIK